MKITKLFSSFTLAEGPVYISEINTLVWVDIDEGKVHFYDEQSKIKDSFNFKEPVGCIVPYKDKIIVCAVKNTLKYFDIESKTILKSVEIFDNPKLRFNDGKCDKYGNLWIGTMAIDYKDEESKNLGSLYCIKKDKIIREYKNFSIPNGLDWFNDFFFHIDTSDNTLYKYEVKDECNLENKEAYLTDFEASPDGMTLDCDNNFWIALWGGKKVICISSTSKKRIDEIYFDDIHTSCVSFGSVDYDTLYVTSAEQNTHKGSIYKIETKYRGKSPNKYLGTIDK